MEKKYCLEMTIAQIVAKSSVFYEIGTFITLFTNSRFVTILSQISPIHPSQTHFLKINFNSVFCIYRSRDSSGGIATGAASWTASVQFLAGE